MTTYTWTNTSGGSWSSAANWSPAGGPPNSSSDQAIIDTSGSYTITVDAGQTYGLDKLTLNAVGVTLSVAGQLNIEGVDHAVSISAGTLQLSARGTLSTSADVTVGAGGTLDVNGTTQIIGSLTGPGTVLLGEGALVVGVGDASSTFVGTIQAGSDGAVGKIGAGSLTFAGVTMSSGAFYVADGSLLQSSGTNEVDYLAIGEQPGSTATASLSGGVLTIGTALQIGDYGGTGTFNQTAGTLVLNGSLNIGNQGGTGTYNLSGGTLMLESGTYDIGRNTGANPTSQGTLNITGGLLDVVSDYLIVGNRETSATPGQGTGLLTQTGGTLRIEAGKWLYLGATGNGEYDLNGGTLEIGGSSLKSNYTGGGTYVFKLGGGTIQVTGTALTTKVNATLTDATTSTLALGGLGATFSGTVSGSGSLVVSGSGTVNLTNLSMSGTLTLEGSTLNLQYSATVGQMIVDGGTLVLHAGKSLSGQVTGTTGSTNTLELASGGGTGTLSGLGTTFSNLNAIVVDAGATWSLTGSNTLESGSTLTNAGSLVLSNATLAGVATLVNNGSITLDAGSLTAAALAGTGTTTIKNGSTLTVTGAVGAGATIAFSGTGSVLALGDPADFVGTISGFSTGDTIDLTGLGSPGSGSANLDPSTDVLTITQGGSSHTIQLSGNFVGKYFHLSSDGATGTLHYHRRDALLLRGDTDPYRSRRGCGRGP
jgi:hypothetical protein